MPYILTGLAIFIVLTVTFFRTPTGRGIWGEFQVKLVLGKSKQDQKYVINNLMVVNEGKSSQIDHLVINRTGIFVIETKNYSGRIYGQEDQREWTQVLQYGKVKNKFYNPIMQNRTHIYALSKVIGRNNCFISIIVFPKATLMTNSTTDVGNIGSFRRRYRQQAKEIFSVEEMNSIYSKLLELKKNPQVSAREHVQEIQQMKANLDNNICPRCGKPLVLRKGQYGEFYGCTGYPQCKFKKTI
jgi:hypothetical protein